MQTFLVSLLFISLSACAGEPILSDTAYGEIKFGSKLSVVQTVLGHQIAQEYPANIECNQLRFEKYPFAYFMVENGVITRVDVESNVTNVLNISVGTTLSEIKKGKPSVVIERHKYDPAGHYVIFKSPSGSSAIVMEEGKGKITNIRAGLEPSVEYVEGCL